MLIGPQGSGKSTQDQVIADFLGIKVLGAGDVLRDAIEAGGELAKKIEPIVDSGALVPDEIILELMTTELAKPAYEPGWLLDGYPRSIEQVHMFEKHYQIDKVFNIEISDEEAIKRISGRRICADCDEIFHVDHNPSSKGEECDKCNGKLIQRDDDVPEVVKKRLSVYRNVTSKLLDYYKKQDKLVVIDGYGTIEEVAIRLKDYLEKNVG
jgi:adenylate kinase